MATVVIVPGLAVRSYAEAAAAALRKHGHEALLLAAPSWRGTPTDLRRYGLRLARDIEDRGIRVDLLVGLSVGTQAAAVAAAGTDRVRGLLLVSPTVDPARRSYQRLLAAWMFAPKGEDAPGFVEQLPDWAHAGILRILLGFRSALRLRLEDVLPGVSAPITVVHAGADELSPLSYATSLAARNRARLVVVSGAPHSWPVNDVERFADLVDELVTA